MRMDKIATAIEDAIEKRCFLPALALTLVIPDICAKYDYPDIYNKKAEYNGRKGQGAAYSKWYDENIGNYDISPLTGIGLIDGFACWISIAFTVLVIVRCFNTHFIRNDKTRQSSVFLKFVENFRNEINSRFCHIISPLRNYDRFIPPSTTYI